MKYFDVLPELVKNELYKRGVQTDKLLYCVKADLDGEGCYIDVYVTFSDTTLYVIKGYEEYRQLTAKERFNEKAHNIPILKSFVSGLVIPEMISYKTVDYDEYDISKIKRIYVDRHHNSAILILTLLNENE